MSLMRFCAIMIGLGDRMANAGIGDGSISIQNGTTEALDRLLARQGA